MTSTELTPQQNFEDKMKARMRENFGDLVPDELLAKLLERLIEETFFTKRKISESPNRNGYEHEKQIESIFSDDIRKLVAPTFNKCMKEFIAANEEKILEMLKEFMEQSASQMILTAFTEQFGATLTNLKFSLVNDLRNGALGNQY